MVNIQGFQVDLNSTKYGYKGTITNLVLLFKQGKIAGLTVGDYTIKAEDKKLVVYDKEGNEVNKTAEAVFAEVFGADPKGKNTKAARAYWIVARLANDKSLNLSDKKIDVKYLYDNYESKNDQAGYTANAKNLKITTDEIADSDKHVREKEAKAKVAAEAQEANKILTAAAKKLAETPAGKPEEKTANLAALAEIYGKTEKANQGALDDAEDKIQKEVEAMIGGSRWSSTEQKSRLVILEALAKILKRRTDSAAKEIPADKINKTKEIATKVFTVEINSCEKTEQVKVLSATIANLPEGKEKITLQAMAETKNREIEKKEKESKTAAPPKVEKDPYLVILRTNGQIKIEETDGKNDSVSKAEFMATKGATAEAFKYFDVNGDNLITEAEAKQRFTEDIELVCKGLGNDAKAKIIAAYITAKDFIKVNLDDAKKLLDGKTGADIATAAGENDAASKKVLENILGAGYAAQKLTPDHILIYLTTMAFLAQAKGSNFGEGYELEHRPEKAVLEDAEKFAKWVSGEKVGGKEDEEGDGELTKMKREAAQAHLVENNNAKAIELYEKILKKVPRDAGIALTLAQLHVQEKQLKKAIGVLEAVIKHKSDDKKANDLLLALYYQKNEFDKAITLIDNQSKTEKDPEKLRELKLQKIQILYTAASQDLGWVERNYDDPNLAKFTQGPKNQLVEAKDISDQLMKEYDTKASGDPAKTDDYQKYTDEKAKYENISKVLESAIKGQKSLLDLAVKGKKVYLLSSSDEKKSKKLVPLKEGEALTWTERKYSEDKKVAWYKVSYNPKKGGEKTGWVKAESVTREAIGLKVNRAINDISMLVIEGKYEEAGKKLDAVKQEFSESTYPALKDIYAKLAAAIADRNISKLKDLGFDPSALQGAEKANEVKNRINKIKGKNKTPAATKTTKYPYTKILSSALDVRTGDSAASAAATLVKGSTIEIYAEINKDNFRKIKANGQFYWVHDRMLRQRVG